MTRRVVVHVGAPKSGTTYLQKVLRHNEHDLRRQGVLVAGRTHAELVHAGFVVREDRRLEQLPARAARAWDRVVRDVRAFEGEVAVISYELLAGASREQAARALAPHLEGCWDRQSLEALSRVSSVTSPAAPTPGCRGTPPRHRARRGRFRSAR